MRALAAAAAALCLVGVASAAPARRVVLHVGDEMTVTMSGTPIPGYVWRIRSVGRKVLEPLGSKFEPARAHGRVAGKGGEYVFRFRALRRGRTLLRFVYARPFAPTRNPRFVTISVVVR